MKYHLLLVRDGLMVKYLDLKENRGNHCVLVYPFVGDVFFKGFY